jgi:hypothetical protein
VQVRILLPATHRDHFFWLENDVGACELEPQMQLPIKVTHYCHLGVDHRFLPWGERAECFHPAKDVCVAPYFHLMAGLARDTYAGLSRERITGAAPPLGRRNTLLFFAGAIRWVCRGLFMMVLLNVLRGGSCRVVSVVAAVCGSGR